MACQARIERTKSRPSRSWAVRGQPASQPKKRVASFTTSFIFSLYSKPRLALDQLLALP